LLKDEFTDIVREEVSRIAFDIKVLILLNDVKKHFRNFLRDEGDRPIEDIHEVGEDEGMR
jgi:hypothetical protein